jgi:nicotinate dehydrogenase subunit A
MEASLAAQSISLQVNGTSKTVEAEPDMPLLYALRNLLALNNPKFGCGLAQCGACTVIVDGQAVRSCALPVSAAAGKAIRTIEGLSTAAQPHPVQAAFIAEDVPFCGYCINCWIMTSVALLEKNPNRTDQDIRNELAGLKCRCGSHMAILRAVKRAAKSMT